MAGIARGNPARHNHMQMAAFASDVPLQPHLPAG
jgi:hypothetical protein